MLYERTTLPPNCICRVCGTPFRTLPVYIRTGRAKFCSKACRRADDESQRVYVDCEGCGKPFHRPPSLKAKYCSMTCRSAGQYVNRLASFWDYVEKTKTCWLWRGFISSTTGYGEFTLGSDKFGAHRAAWLLASGKMPPPKQSIGHTCDDRPCVRNDGPLGIYVVNDIEYPRYGHLFLGSQAANIIDMWEKGRARPRGFVPKNNKHR